MTATTQTSVGASSGELLVSTGQPTTFWFENRTSDVIRVEQDTRPAETWIRQRGGSPSPLGGHETGVVIDTPTGPRVALVGDYVTKFFGHFNVLTPAEYEQMLRGAR